MATITFYGAAQEVTGSCHLIESPAVGRLLLDCGMHQGGDAVDRVDSEQFDFKPSSIDAVVLSHAHLDHSGLVPKLVHEGFHGPIYCTPATADLLVIMLEDSLGLYERDMERENLRRARKGQKPLKPTYNRRDVMTALRLCTPIEYGSPHTIGNDASLCFHNAGHILGSAIIKLTLTEKGQSKTLVFSGDLGKRDAVLMQDPELVKEADIVMMESTYGDRDHRTLDNTLDQFRDILHNTWKKGGNVMIPAFAVGRTQELLYYLGLLHQKGELDNWQVVLDSPMAIEVTRVYSRWLDSLDLGELRPLSDKKGSSRMRNGHRDESTIFRFLPHLHLSVTPEESMAINKIKKGAIIIAGSGMCTGGRIRHHFKCRIWDKRNTVIFVGFQAYGTLGRILVDGVKHIKLFSEEYLVQASIETLGGFSAHAGQAGLIRWISAFETNPRVVLVHGEPRAMDALSAKLWEEKGIDTCIPRQRQSIAF